MKRVLQAVLLSTMVVDGDESSLLDYTMKWTALVNRGEINDTAYMLFREIELKVRKHLFIAFERSTSMSDYDKRETIVHAVAENEGVQFYWTMLSIDIESEEQAVKLLKEIIGLWVTIRGFSIAGTWIEQYMQANKCVSSKSKGLRKELKRSTEEKRLLTV